MEKGEGSKGKGKGNKGKGKAKAKEEEQRSQVGIDQIAKQMGGENPTTGGGFHVTSLRANNLEELVRCTPRVGDYVLVQHPTDSELSNYSDLTCVAGQRGYRILNERERLHVAWKKAVEAKTKSADKALEELHRKTETLEKLLDDVDRRRAAEVDDQLRKEEQQELIKKGLRAGNPDASDVGDDGDAEAKD